MSSFTTYDHTVTNKSNLIEKGLLHVTYLNLGDQYVPQLCGQSHSTCIEHAAISRAISESVDLIKNLSIRFRMTLAA